MNTYNCPKCTTEFSSGTKFCQNCGCNLEAEFVETPACPKCQKTFSTGSKFCPDDGSKLVSPEKLIPRCVRCGKTYTDGTRFCPDDGGQVRSGVNSKIIIPQTTEWQGKTVLGLSIVVAIINIHIILRYFKMPGWIREFAGGDIVAFPLFLRHDVFGLVIFACVLAAIAFFIDNVNLELSKSEKKYLDIGETINRYAGGLAAVFLVAALFSRIIIRTLTI